MMPNRECPRFNSCSVNNCPLDTGYPDYPASPLDGETTCTLGKTIRIRIAAKYPGVLRFEGLKSREYYGKITWNKKPEGDKQRCINVLNGKKIAS